MTERTQAEALAYAEGVEAGRAAERTRCGNIAMSGTLSMDCDNRSAMDPETGAYECASETRGGVCECALKIEYGEAIAQRIRALPK